jgi:hypothetical protein
MADVNCFQRRAYQAEDYRDRSDIQLRILDFIDQAHVPDSAAPRRLLVLKGPVGVGKTWILRWSHDNIGAYLKKQHRKACRVVPEEGVFDTEALLSGADALHDAIDDCAGKPLAYSRSGPDEQQLRQHAAMLVTELTNDARWLCVCIDSLERMADAVLDPPLSMWLCDHVLRPVLHTSPRTVVIGAARIQPELGLTYLSPIPYLDDIKHDLAVPSQGDDQFIEALVRDVCGALEPGAARILRQAASDNPLLIEFFGQKGNLPALLSGARDGRAAVFRQALRLLMADRVDEALLEALPGTVGVDAASSGYEFTESLLDPHVRRTVKGAKRQLTQSSFIHWDNVSQRHYFDQPIGRLLAELQQLSHPQR